MSKTVFESTLIDALPDSIREDSDVVAIATSLDGEIQRMMQASVTAQWASHAIATGVVDGSHLQSLSGEQLDHVAWSWGSVVWDRDWSETKKRSYVVGILNRKKHLGTAACIRDAFSTIGIDVDVVDCMTDSSIQAGNFMLYTDEPVAMASQWRMLYIVDRIKPVSRHYTWGHRVALDGGAFVGGGVLVYTMDRLEFIACQPNYEFALNSKTGAGVASGTIVQLDFDAVQPPVSNGYIYDAATDTLTAAYYDDDAETVETED